MRPLKALACLIVIILLAVAGCGGGGGGSGATTTPPDTTAPTVTVFTIPATSTSMIVPISSFIASDNIGVTGYLVTDSATAPAPSAAGWAVSAPTSFIFSAAGSKTAYAWAKDAAGNVSAAKSANVTITLSDTTAPTVSVTAPSNNATVNGTLLVSANASDNVGVTKVEFYVDNVLKSTDTAAPYDFSWYTTTVANGAHTLSAKAYDAAGNMGQSANISVTVTNTITASMNTVISGTNAVGKVSIAGAPSPIIYGLDLIITYPSGVTVVSATQSGVATTASSPFPGVPGLTDITYSMPSTNGFGSGEVMTINFSNVPAGNVGSDFGVILVAVYGSGGGLIQ